MTELHPRMVRERRTMASMIGMYCRGRHKSGSALCEECQELLDFAESRLSRCPYQEDKPTCGGCPIHCYKPDRREQIRQVMRHSGPRMIFRHPIFLLRHWLDGMKKTPSLRREQRR